MSIHRLASSCILAAGFGAALACGPAFGADPSGPAAKSTQQTVVFVCKYGSVKSLVAAERFNRLAEQRGLSVRAIGRAANPGTLHTEVPELVARQLNLEGYHVANYQPRVLTPEEAAAAVRVVHISLQGEPDPDSSVAAAAHVSEERWDDVPTMLMGADGKIDMTGHQYAKARSQLVPHVDTLFQEVTGKQGNTATQ
jgi:protein-tyrosine-phosphatase